MVKKYTEKEKLNAVVLAEATSFGHASKESGIPKGTIFKWAQKYNGNGNGNKTETKRSPKKIKQVSEAATKQATEAVANHLTERAKVLAEEMIQDVYTVKNSLLKAIEEGKTESEYNSQWVRALTGAMDYLIKNSNVLLGNDAAGGSVNVNVSNQNIQQTANVGAKGEEMPYENRMAAIRALSSPFDRGSPQGNAGNPTKDR